MYVQLRLHLLFPVKGDEGNLTGGVPHQVQGIVDLLNHVDVPPRPLPGLLATLLRGGGERGGGEGKEGGHIYLGRPKEKEEEEVRS